MNKSDIMRLFQAIDNKDTETFLSFLSDDAVFRFGNIPPVEGRENIGQFLDNWFPTIRSVSHDQIEIWEAEGVKIMNGRVTYTRHDGSKLPVFFSNTFKMKGEKIREYFIFVDTSQLYAAFGDAEAEPAAAQH